MNPAANPVGVVLGSGLGAFAETLSNASETPYSSIPGWPVSTIVGHAGKLIEGYIDDTPVIVLAGRAHLYEGYSARDVTFSIRELARRGVRNLILTNAAGGINLSFHPGDLVLLSDHINLQATNPLIGPNDESLGPRFPDMSEAYSADLRSLTHQAAKNLNITLREGVYAGVLGPSFETPAEIRYLRAIGADLVGMSTVAESIVANHMGMRVLGISCVTNMAAGVLPQKLSHAEVIETGERVKGTLIALLQAAIPAIGRSNPPQ